MAGYRSRGALLVVALARSTARRDARGRIATGAPAIGEAEPTVGAEPDDHPTEQRNDRPPHAPEAELGSATAKPD